MSAPLFDDITSSWDMDALDVPLLVEAYRYWLSKKGERPWPLRSSIEPTEIPRLLPNLFLIEVAQIGPPMRYRVRLVGTAFRPFFGTDITGHEVREEDEVSPDRARFCSDWREILQRGAPRWARIRQQVRGEQAARDGIAAARFTGLALPLSRDGTAADMLLGATVYDPVH